MRDEHRALKTTGDRGDDFRKGRRGFDHSSPDTVHSSGSYVSLRIYERVKLVNRRQCRWIERYGSDFHYSIISPETSRFDIDDHKSGNINNHR